MDTNEISYVGIMASVYVFTAALSNRQSDKRSVSENGDIKKNKFGLF